MLQLRGDEAPEATGLLPAFVKSFVMVRHRTAALPCTNSCIPSAFCFFPLQDVAEHCLNYITSAALACSCPHQDGLHSLFTYRDVEHRLGD